MKREKKPPHPFLVDCKAIKRARALERYQLEVEVTIFEPSLNPTIYGICETRKDAVIKNLRNKIKETQ